jgi:hypothetical protein
VGTNISINGDTFFATGTTSPTNYIDSGANITLNGVIARKFTGSTMTNFMTLKGSGRVTWQGFNNVSSACTNIVTANSVAIPIAALSGFANQAGAFYYLDSSGHPFYHATNTAAATVGAQTINKTTGTVNFAASATSLVVTNSLVSATSLVFCVIRTNDATLTAVQAVPGAGTFTIYGNAAATAETSVGFLVVN